MKIGLIDVDGHAKKKKFGATIYPNLALCKISAYHKAHGDSVEWYDPMYSGHCDIVYVSKIFNFSPDIPFFIDADKVITGGTQKNLCYLHNNSIYLSFKSKIYAEQNASHPGKGCKRKPEGLS